MSIPKNSSYNRGIFRNGSTKNPLLLKTKHTITFQARLYSLYENESKLQELQIDENKQQYVDLFKEYSLKNISSIFQLSQKPKTVIGTTFEADKQNVDQKSFQSINAFARRFQDQKLENIVDRYIQNADSLGFDREFCDDEFTRINYTCFLQQNGDTNLAQGKSIISNAGNCIEHILNLANGNLEISENEFLIMIERVKDEKMLQRLDKPSMYTLETFLISSLKKRNTPSEKYLTISLTKFILREILESSYCFDSTMGYNKLIGILSLINETKSAINIKNALRLGIFGRKLTVNSETYESLLYYSKFAKLDSFDNSNSFGDNFKMTFDTRLYKQDLLPDPGEIVDNGSYSWTYLLFSEIVKRNIELTSNLEKLLILAACRNRDVLLLHTLLQKSESTHRFTTKNKTFAKYIKNSHIKLDSFELVSLRNKIWSALKISTPIKREINKFEKIIVPQKPVPNINTNIISDSTFAYNQVKFWHKGFPDLQLSKYGASTNSQTPNRLNNTSYNSELGKSINYYKYNSDAMARQRYLFAVKTVATHSYLESYWASYEYYLETLLKQRRWKFAFVKLLEFRYKAHKPPSSKIYKYFVNSLVRRKEIELVTEIFFMMRSDGANISNIVLERLISGCMKTTGGMETPAVLRRFRHRMERDHSVYFNKSLFSKGFTDYKFWNKHINQGKRPEASKTSESSAFKAKTGSNKRIISDNSAKLELEKPNRLELENSPSSALPDQSLTLHDELVINKKFSENNKEAIKSKIFKLEDKSFQNDFIFDWADNILIFPNKAIFYYTELKKMRNRQRSHGIELKHLSLDTALSITNAVLSASDQTIRNLAKTLNDDTSPIFKISGFGKNDVGYIRNLAIIELYSSEISIYLKHSCVTNNLKQFTANRDYDSIFILASRCFYSFKLYSETERVIQEALKVGLVL